MSDNAGASSNGASVSGESASNTTTAPTNTDNTAQNNQSVSNGSPVANQNNNDSAFDGLFDESNNAQSNVPDQYVFTDGNGNEYSQEDTAEVSAFMRDVGLSQEQANKVFNAFVTELGDSISELRKQATIEDQKQVQEWKRALTNDRELGGMNLQATKANVKRAMETYGSPELRKYLNETGYGFHPAVMSFLNKVGKTLSADTGFVNGTTAPRVESDVDMAKRLYPNTPELWKKR